MDNSSSSEVLRLGLPKGRMAEGVLELLRDAGVRLSVGAREYRPTLSLPGIETKILKPQNIIEMLHVGSRDIGFAGADWVAELQAEVVELLDTGLDPIALVAAAPRELLVDGALPVRPLIIAAEYERLTREWINRRGLTATFVRSFGATEVFPPEDADCIIDVTATGATLTANDLQAFDTLMKSTTRLYANPRVLDNVAARKRIDRFVLLLRSVLDARRRVMVEINVAAARFDDVVAILPCMRRPTVSRLHGEESYAVKVAVPRDQLPALIPEIQARGGTDIVTYELSQIVP